MYAGETMISGYTGEAFRTDIFIGPVYYQRLRHMVSDKFQVCCPRCFLLPALCWHQSVTMYVVSIVTKAFCYNVCAADRLGCLLLSEGAER